MTREEKVEILEVLRVLEEEFGSAVIELKKLEDKSIKNDILDPEKGRDRVHTLAESLQAEIDEIEEMEIQVLSGKGERDDTV